MAATIYDVAKSAGVSISTVSRILNDSARVSDKKREAVLKAMKELNFEPNQFARGLVNQQTDLVGIYFPTPSGSIFDSIYSTELLKGIEDVTKEKNLSLVLIGEHVSSAGNNSTAPKFLQYVRQKRIDGLILSNINSKNSKDSVFDELIERKFPAVYIGKKVHERGMNIYAQYEKYSMDMVDRLVANGHKKILFLSSILHKNYQKELKKNVNRKYPDVDYCNVEVNDERNLKIELAEILNRYVFQEGYTSLCSSTMEWTEVLISLCQEMKIEIPQQLSILSVEHRENHGSLIYPGISAYYVPTREMGRGAARMIIEGMTKGELMSKSLEYATVFVERNSICRIGDN